MPATNSNHPQQGGAPLSVEPIYVTARDAASILSTLLSVETSPWTVHRLCRLGALDSRFHGKRRMVVLASLRDYATNLPKPPEPTNADEASA